jgi:hypothetical protein
MVAIGIALALCVLFLHELWVLLNEEQGHARVDGQPDSTVALPQRRTV